MIDKNHLKYLEEYKPEPLPSLSIGILEENCPCCRSMQASENEVREHLKKNCNTYPYWEGKKCKENNNE